MLTEKFEFNGGFQAMIWRSRLQYSNGYCRPWSDILLLSANGG